MKTPALLSVPGIRYTSFGIVGTRSFNSTFLSYRLDIVSNLPTDPKKLRCLEEFFLLS